MSIYLTSSSDDSDEEYIVEELINLPRPRLYRDRFNPLEQYDDFDFKIRFRGLHDLHQAIYLYSFPYQFSRLTKNTFMNLLNLIGNNLKYLTRRSYAIKPEIQLLVALRYYATGAFQVVLGDHVQVHKSTVCRIVKRVSKCIACLRPHFISMPKTQIEQQETQIEFYQKYQFPRVIGAIDCTHIKIQSPNSNIGEQFRNRKGYFSINVQAVCNSKMEIMNIVARWPGSVHDSTIFDNSLLRSQIENNEFKGCFLLGDGGYPCRPYLMTPLLNPTTDSERKYQKSQIATRNVIERVFGVLKRRFPVLSVGMRIQTKTALTVIVATAVLYNILLQQNDDLPQNDQQLDINVEELQALPVRQVGNIVRNNLIETHFSQ